MAYQRERANVSDQQWEKEYTEKLRQFNEQMAENKRQFDLNMEYMQDEFKYKYGLAGGGSSGGGGSGNGGYTPAPNDDTDKERFNLATVAGAAGIIDAGNLFGNALSLGLSNVNPKNYSDLEKKQSSDTKKIGGAASGLSSGGSVSKSEKDKLNKLK